MKYAMLGAAALSLMAGAAQAANIIVGGESGGLATAFTTPGLSAGAAVQPYPGFGGGVRVAVGDVNGDGVDDIITGAGAGGQEVKVFDGVTGQTVRSFNPFAAGYTGGVRVAAGDLNGDGVADIVVGAGEGSAVRVFDGLTLDTLHSFNAFGAGFTGGVSVAVGQDDDGRAALIVGAGAGGAPVVNIYDPLTGLLAHSFLAFDPNFQGGVNVASLNKVGPGILAFGAQSLSSQVRVLDLGTQLFTHDFFAFNGFTGGVSVGGGLFGGINSLIVGQQTGGAQVNIYDPNGRGLAAFRAYADADGVNVAGSFVVPEPATWAVMILGFFGLGAQLRRRRKAVVA